MGNETIEAGDVVEVKSGGPRMTVDWVEEGEVCCTWFSRSKREQAKFRLTTLKKVD